MSYGIIEIISLLLGLAGFGLHANPKAPTADQALEYAMVDPDVTMHFDAQSVIPGNYKALLALADAPQIKSSPDLSKVVREAIGQVEGARGAAKVATGIDFSNDIDDATVFAQFVAGQNEPNAIVAVHGKFPSNLLDKLAGLSGGKVTTVGSGSYLESPDHKNGLAITKDHVLIGGTLQLVKDRLADTWKMPSHTSGTLASVAQVINDKPVFAVVLSMSPQARKAALAAMGGGQNFATDLVGRHKLASFVVYHDGIGWQWIDSTRAGLDSMATFSDGSIDLLRAAQIAPRGFAKIVLAGLESYKGTDKRVDEMLRHKDDLTKIVEAFTGDGTFQKKVDKDTAKLSLTVRLTGKTLSEVVPVGALIPFMGLGMVMTRGKSSSSGSTQPQPIAVPVQGGHH